MISWFRFLGISSCEARIEPLKPILRLRLLTAEDSKNVIIEDIFFELISLHIYELDFS